MGLRYGLNIAVGVTIIVLLLLSSQSGSGVSVAALPEIQSMGSYNYSSGRFLSRGMRGSIPIGANGEAVTAKTYLFGVVNDQGEHYGDLWNRGIRATTFEFQWKHYEPQEGLYDQSYINHMKQILRELNNQGWHVQLVPGYHYAPEWVFQNYPDMYFVNQYGEKYDPDPVESGDFRVINAPFNPQARELISGYINRIFTDFDQTDPSLEFDSIRIGGGVQGELRYPPKDWNTHSNSYWAFDKFAQDPQNSGIPDNVQGWRPGIDPNPGSLERGQLIVNPGFENEHPFFEIPGWTPDDEITASVVSGSYHSGSLGLELIIDSPNRIHQYVRVSPNTTYKFEGWFKTGQGDSRARLFVTQYDNTSQPVEGPPFVKLESESGSWTKLTGDVTTAAETSFLKVELDGDRPGIYYFDDIWLQRDGDTNAEGRDIIIPLSFYDWYIDSQTQFQNWQIAEIRKYFQGQLDVVYAGKGVRAAHIIDALTNDLLGDGWSEKSNGLYAAAVYELHISKLDPFENIYIYLTGIEDPPEDIIDDYSPYPSNWSAARWLKHLSYLYGLPIWGENSGQDNVDEMRLSIERMIRNNFMGMMWVSEAELYPDLDNSTYATADDYEQLISEFTYLYNLYVPITFAK